MLGKMASSLTYGGRRQVVYDDIREESRSQKKQGFAGQSKKLRFHCKCSGKPLRVCKRESGMM